MARLVAAYVAAHRLGHSPWGGDFRTEGLLHPLPHLGCASVQPAAQQIRPDARRQGQPGGAPFARDDQPVADEIRHALALHCTRASGETLWSTARAPS